MFIDIGSTLLSLFLLIVYKSLLGVEFSMGDSRNILGKSDSIKADVDGWSIFACLNYVINLFASLLISTNLACRWIFCHQNEKTKCRTNTKKNGTKTTHSKIFLTAFQLAKLTLRNILCCILIQNCLLALIAKPF